MVDPARCDSGVISNPGRGQARPCGAADQAANLATCNRPRCRGRGFEAQEVARDRGRSQSFVLMAGMRRSEVSALR